MTISTSDCQTIVRVGQREESCVNLNMSAARRRSVSEIIARTSWLWARASLEILPIRLTLGNLGFLTVVLAVIMPRAFTYILVYPIFRLVFGTLYPAYASYKAVRTKNVKEYVKWMMYWIVFALFTCAETFTDVFFSFWFPFYYEIKIILVLWLLSPATKGSSILYRRFVHPALSRREAEIDEALARATEQGYTAVLHLGTRGVNYATTVLMQTAIKGGGGLVQQLKKSYSLSDLTGEKEDENRNTSSMRDETDMEVEPRRREHPGRRGYSPRRTQSSSNRVEMYFSEVDVDVRQPRSRDPIASLTNIRSSDDISSGYSSGEALQTHRVTSQGDSLLRTSSVGARTRARQPRSATTKKVPEDDEEDDDVGEVPSSDRLQFSSPLSLLTAEQTLEILLLLSQLDPDNKQRIFESITSKLENRDDRRAMTSETSENNLTTIQEIVELPKVDISEKSERIIGSSGEETSMKIDIDKITDEICQDRLDRLKVLLNNAHTAVTNIVSSYETVESTEKETSKQRCVVVGALETGSLNSIDRASTTLRDVSPCNSESDCRAGKYKKKPAPKPPAAVDHLDDESTSQSALKATLVIKTGTLKTFTNDSQTKNVFVSHRPETSKSMKKKTRGKDGFSKLLTIPKSIFHNTFHKERKDDAAKDEDSSSIVSESSASTSRSVSVGSLNNFDPATLIKEPPDVQDKLMRALPPDDNSRVESYLDPSATTVCQHSSGTSAPADDQSKGIASSIV